jgi:glycosyltransferase involved in cell wall biosynthesis
LKILIVSPFFPPFGTVAIVRISSLAHELLKSGHEITILRNEYDERIDKLSDSDQQLLDLKTHTVKVNQSIRYFEASKRYKYAFRKVMDEDKFDLVIITAGPYYTIPLCRVAKEEYGTKCIIDYRDLWLLDMRNITDFLKPVNIAKKLVYFPIERSNIKSADLVVTVTEEWKQILMKVYKGNKFEVVKNGYDDAQLNKIDSSVSYPYKDKFVIAVFGKLSYYSEDYGTKFFSAMNSLSEKYPSLIVLHIGIPEKETERAIMNTGFDSSKYINTGFIKYTDGIELLKHTNACVIIDVRKGAMGTKFYDYVYVNKPLIYLGKKNTHLDNLVKGFKNGFSCYNEVDVVDAVNKIEEEGITSMTETENVEKYARTKQNRKYLELIDSIH